MVRKHATRLIFVALLFAACDPTEQPSPPPAPSRSPAPVTVVSDPHNVCANGTETATDPSSRTGPVLRDDVDGDGSPDEVWMAVVPEGPAGCRTFLVVETETSLYWAATDISEVPSSLAAPRINSLVDVDGDPGAEIVANLEAGASTEFVAVFTLTRAGLERMSIDGEAPGPFGTASRDLFAYGGSVGHLDAVDCAGDGLVVMSSAIPSGDRAEAYTVERRFFEATHSGFSWDEDLTEVHTIEGLRVDDFPEFAASPFGSCG